MAKIREIGTLRFNKELIFGEVGSLIGAPLFADIASYFTSNGKSIAFSALAGAIIGASAFWLASRAYDKKMSNNPSAKGMVNDVLYFTPVAFLASLLIYYPTLFFGVQHLLVNQYGVLSSVISSQLVGFFIFLTVMNTYRYFLAKFFGKVL